MGIFMLVELQHQRSIAVHEMRPDQLAIRFTFFYQNKLQQLLIENQRVFDDLTVKHRDAAENRHAKSVLDQRRAPGKTATKGFEQQHVATFDTAITHRSIQRQRH